MEPLIVFLIVFVPMGWLMWRMLQSTRDSIGSRSPLKVNRVYETTAWSFFVSFESFYALHALLFGGFSAYCVIFVRFATPNPELGRLLMSLLGLIVTGLGIMIVAVDLNHWKFARHITIETFPKEHELEVHLKDFTLRLKDGDIDRIVVYSNNTRLNLGFVSYYLANGGHFALPFKTKGMRAIQEYFKNVRVEYRIQRIPLIPVTDRLD
ncbi:hypothetical protein [Dyadobacter fermentans]|uniref:hypothetical protein n=1 Tax=Dyadobacter fermentans TaxID=94254 RepID=UPI001CBB90E7|nr:hypothetical protein [Dyadobacter fermentans]MBZ1362731.1 hypothetical protein [Dyadobacter fermentans]